MVGVLYSNHFSLGLALGRRFFYVTLCDVRVNSGYVWMPYFVEIEKLIIKNVFIWRENRKENFFECVWLLVRWRGRKNK